jgi:hypothetical protein
MLSGFHVLLVQQFNSGYRQAITIVRVCSTGRIGGRLIYAAPSHGPSG